MIARFFFVKIISIPIFEFKIYEKKIHFRRPIFTNRHILNKKCVTAAHEHIWHSDLVQDWFAISVSSILTCDNFYPSRNVLTQTRLNVSETQSNEVWQHMLCHLKIFMIRFCDWFW